MIVAFGRDGGQPILLCRPSTSVFLGGLPLLGLSAPVRNICLRLLHILHQAALSVCLCLSDLLSGDRDPETFFHLPHFVCRNQNTICLPKSQARKRNSQRLSFFAKLQPRCNRRICEHCTTILCRFQSKRGTGDFFFALESDYHSASPIKRTSKIMRSFPPVRFQYSRRVNPRRKGACNLREDRIK